MKKTILGCALVALLCGCPPTTGKLRVINNSDYEVISVAAWNLADEYWVQLYDYNIQEEHIQPGETKTLSVQVEGYYNIHAVATGKTWGKNSLYFGPGVFLTWTLANEGTGEIEKKELGGF